MRGLGPRTREILSQVTAPSQGPDARKLLEDLTMSDDPLSTLDQQIAHWEEREARAKEELRVTSEILPGLRQARERLKLATGLGQDSKGVVEAPVAEEAPAEVPPEPPLAPLKRSEDVQGAIEAIVGDLPSRFEQSDVLRSLEDIGLTVNRSTLRSNLQLLAQAGQRFRVKTEGRGRRATIFEKVTAEEEA